MNAKIAALAAPVVLGLWMLGAYNRLVRMRNGIAGVFSSFAQQAHERAEVVAGVLTLARQLLPTDAPQIEATVQAGEEAARTLDAARARPVDHDLVARFGASDHALGQALATLCEALREHVGYADTQADPDQQHPVVTELGRLDSTLAQVDFARMTYNLAAADYNDAARLFPTALVAKLFRFGPAALLPATPRSLTERRR